LELFPVLVAFLSLGLGGILKGATGAGAPIIALPALAILFDVQTAIAIFSLPNLFANIWQGWTFRREQRSKMLVWGFAGCGALGMVLGTYFLTILSPDKLEKALGAIVLLFVGFKIINPQWILLRHVGIKIAPITGLFAGALQGVTGLSAPISLSFLNAMRLERSEFIATIAVFFGLTALPQIALLIYFNILTPSLFIWSFLGTFPVIGFIPFGQYLAKKWSRETFDKIILSLLVIIAAKLLFL
tara:strand:- start:418 stop:1149 length:732 start_codon:yes stop_codon:yes gene_type:complete